MFRLWGKIWKENRLLRDALYENGDPTLNRTKKVFAGVEEFCREFDLPKPIWLEANIQGFKKHSRTRFTQDSFIEEIPFDYFEILVLEEDNIVFYS